MGDKIKELLSLLRKSNNEKIVQFVNKYNAWFAFFSETSGFEDRPRVYSLIADLKLIVLCGLAESLGIGNGPREKFRQFLDRLSIEEKIFFSLIVNLKQKKVESQKIWEQYLNSGSEELLKKIMDIHDQESNDKEKEIEKILISYPDDHQYLEEIFKKRIELLYDVRSKIVHRGLPVSGTIITSSGEITYYGEKGSIFFTIKYPVEEFFIRAACRYDNIEPNTIVPSIERYCNDNLILRHAWSQANLVYNLKQDKSRNKI